VNLTPALLSELVFFYFLFCAELLDGLKSAETDIVEEKAAVTALQDTRVRLEADLSRLKKEKNAADERIYAFIKQVSEVSQKNGKQKHLFRIYMVA